MVSDKLWICGTATPWKNAKTGEIIATDNGFWRHHIVGSVERTLSLRRPTCEESLTFATLRKSGFTRQKLMVEEPHHHIIVPGSVHQSRFSFPALIDEATFFVGADSALIVGEHPYTDPE